MKPNRRERFVTSAFVLGGSSLVAVALWQGFQHYYSPEQRHTRFAIPGQVDFVSDDHGILDLDTTWALHNIGIPVGYYAILFSDGRLKYDPEWLFNERIRPPVETETDGSYTISWPPNGPGAEVTSCLPFHVESYLRDDNVLRPLDGSELSQDNLMICKVIASLMQAVDPGVFESLDRGLREVFNQEHVNTSVTSIRKLRSFGEEQRKIPKNLKLAIDVQVIDSGFARIAITDQEHSRTFVIRY